MKREPIRIEGLKDVYKALNGLPPNVKGAALRSVHRKAAAITQGEMVRRAPVGSSRTSNTRREKKMGDLRDNIKIGNDRENLSGVIVGVFNAFWARFIERGTKQRTTQGRGKYRAGANRGKVTARPFIEPAIESTYQKTAKYINKNYMQIIKSYLQRKNKRISKKP